MGARVTRNARSPTDSITWEERDDEHDDEYDERGGE